MSTNRAGNTLEANFRASRRCSLTFAENEVPIVQKHSLTDSKNTLAVGSWADMSYSIVDFSASKAWLWTFSISSGSSVTWT